jgi:dTDP-4-amino-4,6-dideoxygalactose transaminase
MIGLSEACLGEEEERAVLAVLRSKWLTQGEKVVEFEGAFSRLYPHSHAVAVNSCTSGLHLTLAALGIGPGDEVLVPGLTFVATANAVVYAGASPVPVDITGERLPHIDVSAAIEALSPKSKAVIVMHYAGYSVDLTAWRQFAEKHDLLLIEDAAHAPGLRNIGQYSTAAVFSFFGNKNMTTAEGGMIIARDAALAERMKRLRGHAMSSPTIDRALGHAFSYDITELGWNYRLDDLRASLGIVQLARLAESNRKRGCLSALYRDLLARHLPSVLAPFSGNHPAVWHLMPVVLPVGTERTSIMARLREHRIQSSIHYPPWHKFIWHQAHTGDRVLPRTEDYSARTLSLPLHPGLTPDDVERVVTTLAGVLA